MTRDYTKLLGAALQQDPLWLDLMRATGRLTQALVQDPGNELRNVEPDQFRRGDEIELPDGRRAAITNIQYYADNGGLDEVTALVDGVEVVLPFRTMQSKATLTGTAKMLGVDFLSDKLTDDDYYRLVSYVSSYWPASGTSQFVNFMGYLKNMRLATTELWSSTEAGKDYVVFVESGEAGTPVWEGGTWYPTSHIQMDYDVERFNAPDFKDLTALFYLLAPIHLVLSRFTATLEGSTEHNGRNRGLDFASAAFPTNEDTGTFNEPPPEANVVSGLASAAGPTYEEATAVATLGAQEATSGLGDVTQTFSAEESCTSAAHRGHSSEDVEISASVAGFSQEEVTSSASASNELLA
jgi:hypothetical protein